METDSFIPIPDLMILAGEVNREAFAKMQACGLQTDSLKVASLIPLPLSSVYQCMDRYCLTPYLMDSGIYPWEVDGILLVLGYSPINANLAFLDKEYSWVPTLTQLGRLFPNEVLNYENMRPGFYVGEMIEGLGNLSDLLRASPITIYYIARYLVSSYYERFNNIALDIDTFLRVCLLKSGFSVPGEADILDLYPSVYRIAGRYLSNLGFGPIYPFKREDRPFRENRLQIAEILAGVPEKDLTEALTELERIFLLWRGHTEKQQMYYRAGQRDVSIFLLYGIVGMMSRQVEELCEVSSISMYEHFYLVLNCLETVLKKRGVSISFPQAESQIVQLSRRRADSAIAQYEESIRVAERLRSLKRGEKNRIGLSKFREHIFLQLLSGVPIEVPLVEANLPFSENDWRMLHLTRYSLTGGKNYYAKTLVQRLAAYRVLISEDLQEGCFRLFEAASESKSTQAIKYSFVWLDFLSTEERRYLMSEVLVAIVKGERLKGIAEKMKIRCKMSETVGTIRTKLCHFNRALEWVVSGQSDMALTARSFNIRELRERLGIVN